MRTRRRKLIVSRIEYGAITAGRCSACHRTFEIELGPDEALSEARERLQAIFDDHVCNKEADQAVCANGRDTTEK
jgi:hypothetical protein